MHAGSHFKFREALLWTRRDIYKFFLISAVATASYDLLGFSWVAIPWLPIALIGTAVAFLIGFKNNNTYNRLWEARKVWGELVNSSRNWALLSRDFITSRFAESDISEEKLQNVRRRLVYRHLAWLIFLKYELRKPRPWETMTKASGKEFKKRYSVPEEVQSIDDALSNYAKVIKIEAALNAHNPMTQLMSEQSRELLDLFERGFTDDFRHMEMEKVIMQLVELQGACERIKNFPYPRQFATTNRYFVWIFLLLLPFGMLKEFEKLGEYWIWMTIPFSILVSWIYHSMERIGESTENPFQGGANDVPISELTRKIEIDLLGILGEESSLEPIQPVNNILL